MTISFLFFNLLLTFGNDNVMLATALIVTLITIGLCFYYIRNKNKFNQDDIYMSLFILTVIALVLLLLVETIVADGNMDVFLYNASFFFVVFLFVISLIQSILICKWKNKKIIPLFIASLISIVMFIFFIFTFDVKTVENYVNNEYMPNQYQRYMKECSYKYINESDRKSFHLFMFECIGAKNKQYWRSFDEAVKYNQKQENIQIIEERILKNKN